MLSEFVIIFAAIFLYFFSQLSNWKYCVFHNDHGINLYFMYSHWHIIARIYLQIFLQFLSNMFLKRFIFIRCMFEIVIKLTWKHFIISSSILVIFADVAKSLKNRWAVFPLYLYWIPASIYLQANPFQFWKIFYFLLIFRYLSLIVFPSNLPLADDQIIR